MNLFILVSHFCYCVSELSKPQLSAAVDLQEESEEISTPNQVSVITTTHEEQEEEEEKAIARSELIEDDTIESNSSSTPDSTSSSSSSSSGNDYELNKKQNNNSDNSSKRLISEESSNQIDIEKLREEKEAEEEEEDDQPVTTDLTLTKTVQLTEYDQEPEIDEAHEKTATEINEDEDDKVQCKVHEPVAREEKVMMMMLEEPIDIKEMSHNYESTMDDISDAELESLEQELDDLVAASAGSLEKISEENAFKSLEEESNEKTVEIEEKKIPEDVVEETQQQPSESETKIKIEESKESEESAKVIEENAEQVIEHEVSSSVIENDLPESISEAQEAVEPPSSPQVVPPSPVLSNTSSTDESASIQNLPSASNEDFSVNESNSTGSLTSEPKHGSVPPYWIPDDMTNQCMQCDQKFSLIKRRHHCRACGLLLCAGCCKEKFFLHYLQGEGRICGPCHEILVKAQQQQQPKNPNPANPLEYCSTIPIQQQVSTSSQQPIAVMVPTGVLKRSSGSRSTERKSVIFSDGIRPGTDLDEAFSSPPTATAAATTTTSRVPAEKSKFSSMPIINEKNNSFIPENGVELPPILVKEGEYKYVDNNLTLMQRLRQEELKFSINKNFYVTVKIVTRECYFSFTIFITNFSLIF